MATSTVRSVVVAVSLCMLAASCASSQKREPVASSAPVEQPRKGGTLTLGALAEPLCADWYDACGNNVWGRHMLSSQTLPRAFDFDGTSYRPSILLSGEPTLAVGPPQVVTYRINPQAVWSDGTRITSADFTYTADQAKAAANSTAASAVETVDASDPATVVVTFKDPTPAWRDNFNRLLPSHLLSGKDRNAILKQGYTFSGGPWALDRWTKGVEIKLVRNNAYWGPKPNLDSVVFKVITDTSPYKLAYQTGQLDMAYFPGAQKDVADLRELAGTHYESSVGLGYEVILFNTAKAPLDSKAVRQALAYATDRDAILSQQSKELGQKIIPTQALMSPKNIEWYSEPFSRYTPDRGRVEQLMTGDGWVKDGAGTWTKNGTRAAVQLNTAKGNQRRETTQLILQSQWREAGFDVSIDNVEAASFTGTSLPGGNFQAAILSLTPVGNDPNLCGNFCSRNIPGPNRPGGNHSRISSNQLDDLWDAVAKEVDDVKRRGLVNRAQQAMSEEMPALPLSPVIDIVVYNEAKVGGVKATPNGPFSNLSEWYCRSEC